LSTTSAGLVAQYTIPINMLVAVPQGGTVVVTFPLGTTVPSSIAASAISVAQVSSTPTTKVLDLAPTVSGRAVTIITPIALSTGSSTIIFSTTAAISNPSKKTDIGAKTLTVSSSSEATGLAGTYTIVQTFSLSPASAKRDATVTVSGSGYTPSTAGAIVIGSSTQVIGSASTTGGSFTVDSSGNLTGSFVANSGTNKSSVLKLNEVFIQDQGDGSLSVVKAYTQLASAVPSSTESSPSGTVSVAIKDFTVGGTITSTITLVAAPAVSGAAVASISSGTYKFTVPSNTSTGTKTVVLNDGSGKTASFLLTIVLRTITVTPTSAVPGQSVTIAGSGFTKSATTSMTLDTSAASVVVVTAASPITINTDGSFLFAGKVPYSDTVTATGGTKTWTATDSAGLVGTTSGFSVQTRSITLSPSTAGPGTLVTVTGAGWGVKTLGAVSSQVTLSLSAGVISGGTFPIGATGEFNGAFTVPTGAATGSITVTGTDNNGSGGTAAFAADKTATKTLTVPSGTITATPNTGSTGVVITISGTGFPTQTNIGTLTFGGANALPVPAPATDSLGNVTVTVTVPAATAGGSLSPGAVVISLKVGLITGTASFTIPGPTITISPSSGKPGDSLTIVGAGFSAFSTVGTITVGSVNQVPVPNPLSDGIGGFTATVIIPALNPGTYTVTVTAPLGSAFTGTAQLAIVSASAAGTAVAPATAFQSLTAQNLLSLASAAPPGGTSFGAFVPDLPGDSLTQVQPFGVLILNLSAAANISVSGQPSVAVAANTPTFFAIGSAVTIEVVP
jgi:hypothetical protein